MKDFFKLILCWLAYMAALPVFGILTGALHLRAPQMPVPTTPAEQFVSQATGAAVLILGLYPVVRRLAARPLLRSIVIVEFIFLICGVNNVLEAHAFSHLLDGAIPATVTYNACIALAVGFSMGFLFGTTPVPVALPHHTPLDWSGRVLLIWLAWPVIYTAFGMCVAPFVTSFYTSGAIGLILPPMATILSLQLLRSLIFLAASVPLLVLIAGSRRALWLLLGLAHAVVVGLYGLVGATFFPPIMRILHSAEIACDSFVYAGILVLLFTAARKPFPVAPAQLRDTHPGVL